MKIYWTIFVPFLINMLDEGQVNSQIHQSDNEAADEEHSGMNESSIHLRSIDYDNNL